jgi:hypothetical protein
VEIYRSKQGRKRHDAALLGARHGVSAKAIRDIWRRRTWTRATMHLWTPQERKKYLQKILCKTCYLNGVESAATACSGCLRRLDRPLRSSMSENGYKEASAAGSSEGGPLSPAESSDADLEVHNCYGSNPDSLYSSAAGNLEGGHLGPAEPLDAQLESFNCHDPHQIDWHEFSEDCELSRVCSMRREEVQEPAQDFPHESAFTDVLYNDQGWLIDPRWISYFLSYRNKPE